MLATAGRLPSGPGWAFEFKWDGVRTVSYVDGGRVTVLSRTGRDVTTGYPELGVLAEALAVEEAVLDGEVVAFEDSGRPDFGHLQARMHVQHPRADLLRAVPVTYLVFDLLRWDNHSLLPLPYRERRSLLESLELDTLPHVDLPPSYADVAGDVVLAAAREAGLEGVVAKRLEAPYDPGRRSTDWIKVPLLSTQEVVVGGWQPGEGRRSGGIGSLLLGVTADAGLEFAGHVGTGFSQQALKDIAARLAPLERPTSPFIAVPREHARLAHWVEPTLVAEVEFRNWTRDGRLRAASWRGFRTDKVPADVRAPDR